MKKAICFLIVLVFCLSMTVPVFAVRDVQQADDDFVFSPGEGGFACNHTHTNIENKKNPTCTEDGYSGKEICQDCGEVISAGAVIPSLPHKYNEDGICVDCGTHYDPTTGDVSIAQWVVLMVLAAAGLVAVTVVYRKKFARAV